MFPIMVSFMPVYTLSIDPSDTPYRDYSGYTRLVVTSTEAPRSEVDRSPDRIMVGHLLIRYDVERWRLCCAGNRFLTL